LSTHNDVSNKSYSNERANPVSLTHSITLNPVAAEGTNGTAMVAVFDGEELVPFCTVSTT
jgi:hypothetical protein